MRTPVPLRVNGRYGLKAEQVLPERISLSDHGLCLQDVLDSHLQLRSTLILGALGQHRPGRSYVLVGKRHGGLAVTGSLNEFHQPAVLGCLWFFELVHVSTGALDQHRA